MSEHDSQLVQWAVGSGRNFAKATNKSGPWSRLVKILSEPTVTKERRKDFDKMTKVEQDALKSVDGWISGAQCEGKWRNKANVRPRDLMTLDIDYAEPSLPDSLMDDTTNLSPYEFYVHSSRRHTDEAPRLRMLLPMARLVNKEEYGALVRIVSWLLDNRRNPIQQVDKVSCRVAQMMFMPTVSADGDWFSYRNTGELLDPDEIFAMYEEEVGDWRNLEILPKYDGEAELRQSSDKAEDPTTKKGPVGDFCRAYDIEAAMEKFLPGVYEPTDDASGKPRYTYSGSTSSNGAVVEDGGLFLYSHHGTDPVCEQLVNAFDLVRIHLFGDADKESSPDGTMSSMPSWKAMLEFIGDDDEFRKAQADTKYDMAAMFDDVDDEYYEDEDADLEDDISGEFDDLLDGEDEFDDILGESAPAAPAKKKLKAPKASDWFPTSLDLDKHGRINSTMPNATIILQKDARLFGAIGFNEMSQRVVVRRSLKSKLDIVTNYDCRSPLTGDRWQDHHDNYVRALLESPNGVGMAGYGMKVTDRDLKTAVALAAAKHAFHPVKDYLESVVWDGKPRVDDMLIRYMETPDSTYIREVSRMIMVASVCRVYEPGHKFDYAPIIEGPQGSRKSSFIRALYGSTWFCEVDCRLDDKAKIAETIVGSWVGELPELTSFNKTDHNDAKAFMRRQHDDVRLAFGHHVSEFPRQIVFWGSTNDDKYLKDPTGNRSYWPVDAKRKTKRNPIDVDALMVERDQLWAEAVAIYTEMRRKQPNEGLHLSLTMAATSTAEDLQEAARTQELHEEWAETIRIWADEPILLTQLYQEHGVLAEMFETEGGLDPAETYVVRNLWKQADAAEHALGLHAVSVSYQQKATIERTYALLDEWENLGCTSVRRFGVKARWKVRVGISLEEAECGYTVVNRDGSPIDEIDDVL